MTKSIKNTIKSELATVTSLKWGADEIAYSAFMFPTKHFEDYSELMELSEEEFSDLMVYILSNLPALSDLEKDGMKNAVFSGNRLRVYYSIMQLADHYILAVAETQDYITDHSAAVQFSGNGYSITDRP